MVSHATKHPIGWPVLGVGAIIVVAIAGLIVAFALHAHQIGAFIGIGCAAALAPILGMLFLAWAIDNDENSHGAALAGHAEH